MVPGDEAIGKGEPPVGAEASRGEPDLQERVDRRLTEANRVEVVCRFCGLRRHDPDASHCKACGNLIYQQHAGDEDAR